MGFKTQGTDSRFFLLGTARPARCFNNVGDSTLCNQYAHIPAGAHTEVAAFSSGTKTFVLFAGFGYFVSAPQATLTLLVTELRRLAKWAPLPFRRLRAIQPTRCRLRAPYSVVGCRIARRSGSGVLFANHRSFRSLPPLACRQSVGPDHRAGRLPYGTARLARC